MAHFGWVIAAGVGVILGAIYMLHLMQKLCFGELRHNELKEMRDLGWREWLIYTPLIILVFVIGLSPGWVLTPVQARTAEIFSQLSSHLASALGGLR